MQCKEQSWKWEDGYEWEYPDGEGKKKADKSFTISRSSRYQHIYTQFLRTSRSGDKGQ